MSQTAAVTPDLAKMAADLGVIREAAEATRTDVLELKQWRTQADADLKKAVATAEAAELKAGRPQHGGAAAKDRPERLAKRMHDAYAKQGTFAQAKGECRELFPHLAKDFSTPTAATMDAWAGSSNQTLPMINPERTQPSLLSLIGRIVANALNFSFVRRVAFHQLVADITADASSGASSITVREHWGFYVGQKITVWSGANRDTYTVTAVTRNADGTGALTVSPVTVRAYTASTESAPVRAVSSTWRATPRTKLFPQAAPEDTLRSVAAKALGHGMPVPNASLKFVDQLEVILENDLRNGLEMNAERELLYGDGTADHLDGILTDTALPSYSWSAGVAGDTQIDALRNAKSIAEKIPGYRATAYLMHPDDWNTIAGKKDTTGRPLIGDLQGGTTPRLHGLPVVMCYSLTPGTALVGAFGTAVYALIAEDVELKTVVDVGTVRSDTTYMQVQMRLNQALRIPEALCKVVLDSAPA